MSAKSLKTVDYVRVFAPHGTARLVAAQAKKEGKTVEAWLEERLPAMLKRNRHSYVEAGQVHQFD